MLLVPSCFPTLDTGMVQNIVTRRMGNNERAMFTVAAVTDLTGVYVHIAYVRGTV